MSSLRGISSGFFLGKLMRSAFFPARVTNVGGGRGNNLQILARSVICWSLSFPLLWTKLVSRSDQHADLIQYSTHNRAILSLFLAMKNQLIHTIRLVTHLRWDILFFVWRAHIIFAWSTTTSMTTHMLFAHHEGEVNKITTFVQKVYLHTIIAWNQQKNKSIDENIFHR